MDNLDTYAQWSNEKVSGHYPLPTLPTTTNKKNVKIFCEKKKDQLLSSLVTTRVCYLPLLRKKNVKNIIVDSVTISCQEVMKLLYITCYIHIHYLHHCYQYNNNLKMSPLLKNI